VRAVVAMVPGTPRGTGWKACATKNRPTARFPVWGRRRLVENLTGDTGWSVSTSSTTGGTSMRKPELRAKRGAWGTSTRWHRLSSLCLPCSHTSPGGTSMRKPAMTARRGARALARFLRRKELPGEKEKNALAGCPPRPVVPKLQMPNALCPLDKAFFSFSPALGTHGAQKRAKARSHFHDAGRAAPPPAGTAMPCPYKPPSCREWIPHRWHRLSSMWGTSTRWHRLSSLWGISSRWHRLCSLWGISSRWHRLSSLCATGLHSEGGTQVKQ